MKEELTFRARLQKPKVVFGYFRMAIDRAFNLKGVLLKNHYWDDILVKAVHNEQRLGVMLLSDGLASVRVREIRVHNNYRASAAHHDTLEKKA